MRNLVRRSWLFGAMSGTLLLSVTIGCQRTPPPAQPDKPQAEAGSPSIKIVSPERKTVRRPIEQPGFNIEAFEETPLYPRISGYVGKWTADIGDPVKKDQVLAELDIPEMHVEVQQKEAAVRQASAQVEQAKAAVPGAVALLARAKSLYERLARVGASTLDRDTVEEARLGHEAAKAGLEKAKADVDVAQAHLEVAKANRDYSKTMLRYTQITAPYAGVVTQRNVNTGDFVQPADRGAKGPLYVVSQIDRVRIVINVPGADAGWIKNGDKDGEPVTLRLRGAGGEVFQGKLKRNARSLNPQARTLRTEIELPNLERKFLPGMYVQASITVEHRNVWTLPASAVVTEGDQTFCYRVENGKAVRTPLQVGLTGGGLVEVLKKQITTTPGAEGRWEPIDGSERIVASEVAALTEGQPVPQSPGGK